MQALALDEDVPEQPEDKTIPKYRQIDKVSRDRQRSWVLLTVFFQRAGDYVLSWSDELDKQYNIVAANGPKSTLPKRPAKGDAADKAGPPAKKIKAEGGGSGNHQAEVQKHYQNGTLSKMTVASLKEYLTTQGRSAAGKKAELVERVEELLETK